MKWVNFKYYNFILLSWYKLKYLLKVTNAKRKKYSQFKKYYFIICYSYTLFYEVSNNFQ